MAKDKLKPIQQFPDKGVKRLGKGIDKPTPPKGVTIHGKNRG